MIERLFPKQADNSYAGHRAVLWLLGLLVALKLVMSGNSILDTEAVAAGADGIPLADFGADAARAVLMLFALTALGQLALALVALMAILRYRPLVPLIYLLLLAEHLARRLIVEAHAVPRTGAGAAGLWIDYGICSASTASSIRVGGSHSSKMA